MNREDSNANDQNPKLYYNEEFIRDLISEFGFSDGSFDDLSNWLEGLASDYHGLVDAPTLSSGEIYKEIGGLAASMRDAVSKLQSLHLSSWEELLRFSQLAQVNWDDPMVFRNDHTVVATELPYMQIMEIHADDPEAVSGLRKVELFDLISDLAEFAAIAKRVHEGMPDRPSTKSLCDRLCVTGVALNRDLLCAFRCRVCAVGLGAFALIDRGVPHEHPAFHTNDSAPHAHDFGHDIA